MSGGSLSPTSIAFLHGSNDLYGASRVLADDARTLTEMGHRVSVVLPDPGPLTRLLEDAGARVSIEPLNVLRKVGSPTALRPPLRLPQLVAEADVAVTWTLALSSYLPLLRLRRKRLVASVHEILDGRAGTILARGTGLLASSVMSNSETTTAWMVSAGVNPQKIVLAYPQAPLYDPLPLATVEPPTFHALLAGRVNGHKGHLEAVEASKIVRGRGIDLRLTLLGGSYPGQENHLEDLLAAIDGAEGVTYRGEVPDVRPYLADAEVMLVPTTRPEPFGIVALEAWSAGRRIIASDEGGLAEATRMVEGVSFPSRDVGALADAIERVALDPDLRGAPSAQAAVASHCTQAARREAWVKALISAG